MINGAVYPVLIRCLLYTSNITEIRESPLRANPSAADEEAVKAAEGRDILEKIRPSDYVVSLEINGKSFSSEKLAEHMEKLTISGKSSVLFVIGGSLGLSREVSARADLKLSCLLYTSRCV